MIKVESVLLIALQVSMDLIIHLPRCSPPPPFFPPIAYTSLKLALDGNSSILDPCLWMVVWSKFAILRNDGLLALIILSQHSDAMRMSRVFFFASFIYFSFYISIGYLS